MAPPPRLTVSEWADRERRLSPEASAEPGRWRTDRAAYQRGILDAFSDPTVETVVVMSSAQVGKTEILNNVVGFHVDQDPSPILVVQPTLEMAQAWSKDRLAPMLRDSPCFEGTISSPKSRDAGNTVLHKVFPGGHLTAAGSNSPASLASRPIRVVLCDEVDRYAPSAGTEGDPIALARKRSTTFWNRKLGLFSTPTVRDASRIEAAWAESDQRVYFVPCPSCGAMQALRWAQVAWPKERPEEAAYRCEACRAAWSDAARWQAIRSGEWVAQAPERRGVAGFHLNELYSPWVRVAEMARNFLDAKDYPERLRAFINTSLGETWEDQGEAVDETGLLARRERYAAEVPAPVVLLTAAVDVQDDRLELEVVGWTEDEQTYGIRHAIVMGDPAGARVWQDVLDHLERDYGHELGFPIRVAAACIDSGGHHTQAVYRFCKGRARQRFFAIKGFGGQGKPLVGRPTRSNRERVHLYPVGVDTAKETLFARLRISEPGPGYCHFPSDYDEEFFRQLTSERVVTVYRKGFPKREWVKRGRQRNEALDLRAYNLAAFAILNPDLPRLAERIRKQAKGKAPEPPPETSGERAMRERKERARPRRRSGGFVQGWRR